LKEKGEGGKKREAGLRKKSLHENHTVREFPTKASRLKEIKGEFPARLPPTRRTEQQQREEKQKERRPVQTDAGGEERTEAPGESTA